MNFFYTDKLYWLLFAPGVYQYNLQSIAAFCMITICSVEKG